jgi:hypothetical protein
MVWAKARTPPNPARSPSCRGYGIMVVTVLDDAIATITGFPDPDLFPVFGLPATFEPTPPTP